MATIENFLLRFKVEGQQGIQRVSDGIKGLSNQVSQFGGNVGPLNDALGGILGRLGPIGVAAGAAGAAFAALGLRAVELAGEISDIAGATGIAEGTLLNFKNSVIDAGGKAGDFANIATKLNRSIQEAASGNEQLQDSFRTLGVFVRDANGNVRSTETILREITQKFQEGKLSSAQYAASIRLLGENISKLDLQKLSAVADPIKDEQIRKLDEYGEAIDRIRAKLEGKLISFFGQLALDIEKTINAHDELEKRLNQQGRGQVAPGLTATLRGLLGMGPRTSEPLITRELSEDEKRAARIAELDRLNSAYRPRPSNVAPGAPAPSRPAAAGGDYGGKSQQKIEAEQRAINEFRKRLELERLETKRQLDLRHANEIQALEINAKNEIDKATLEIRGREFLSRKQKEEEIAAVTKTIQTKLANDVQQLRQRQAEKIFQIQEQQREEDARAIAEYQNQVAREEEQKLRALNDFKARLKLESIEKDRLLALQGANQIKQLETNADAEIKKARERIFNQTNLENQEKEEEFAAVRKNIELRLANNIQQIRQQQAARAFQLQEQQREEDARAIAEFEREEARKQEERFRALTESNNRTALQSLELRRLTQLRSANEIQAVEINAANELEREHKRIFGNQLLSEAQQTKEFASVKATIEERSSQEIERIRRNLAVRTYQLEQEQRDQTAKEQADEEARLQRIKVENLSILAGQQRSYSQQLKQLRGIELTELDKINEMIESQPEKYAEIADQLRANAREQDKNIQLEREKNRELEYSIQLFERQREIQQSLADILRDANQQRQEIDFEQSLEKMSPMEQQIAKINESARRAALQASRAFAESFGEGEDGLTPERAEELAAGLEKIAQAFKGIADAQINAITRFKSFEEQLSDSFRKYAESALDNNKIIEQGFERTTQGLEDAFVELATTGKITFKNMANSILADLARIMFRRALVFAGSAIFGLPIPGRAAGGPVNAQQPYVVGEKGPELFVPTTAGKIVPNSELAAGSAITGQTNVTYNIQAVDAASFRALIARDPSFIYSVTERGRRSQPIPARRM